MLNITKEWLYEQLIIQKRSQVSIAKELCICRDTVRRWMRKFNIIQSIEVINYKKSISCIGPKNHFYGKHHTMQARHIMATMKKGKPLSAEHRKKFSLLRLGPGNPAWKNGQWIDDDGYVHVWASGHPGADCRGYVAEHRLVMERLIGRLLRPEEIVHHIDKNTANNMPNNLILCANHIEHRHLHCRHK